MSQLDGWWLACVLAILVTAGCSTERADEPPRTTGAVELASGTPLPVGGTGSGREGPNGEPDAPAQVVVDGNAVAVSRQLLLTLDGQENRPGKLRFSPDGSRLASLGVVRGDLELWDVADGKRLPRLRHPQVDSAEDFAFSADGKELATTHYRPGGAGDVIIWSLSSLKPRLRLLWGYDRSGFGFERIRLLKRPADSEPIIVENPHLQWAHDRLAFAPDGERLALASKDGEQLIVDLRSGETLSWTSQRFRATACVEPVFSPDGKRLAWADNENLNVWDLGWEEPVAYPRDLGAWVVRYLDDGKTIATLGRKGLVLRDVAGGQRMVLKTTSSPHLGAISHDGRLVACIDPPKGVVMVWDVAAGRPIGAVPGSVFSIDFSPDGKSLATCCGTEIHLWDISAMHDAAGETEGFADRFSEQATEPDPPAGPGPAELVWCLEDHSFCQAFSPDSSLLALVYRKGDVILWDLAARQQRSRAETDADLVAFAPNGEYVAAAGLGGGNKVAFELLDVPGLEQRSQAIEPPKSYYPQGIAFAPDGASLAVACGNGLDVWDIRTGRIATTLPVQSDRSARSLAYSSDGATLV